MPFLPWRSFRSWGCQACGECCAKFNLYLSWPEAVFLTHEYGSNVIARRNGRIILKRVGRRCVFPGRETVRHTGTQAPSLQGLALQF
ncbi:MAG: YkgJ family cysteine cluster protein [Candidatus Freyrarchaeum guaymaensis]